MMLQGRQDSGHGGGRRVVMCSRSLSAVAKHAGGVRKSKTLTAADPERRDWMSKAALWHWSQRTSSVALAGLTCRSSLAEGGSRRCRWPIGQGLRTTRNALASHLHHLGGCSRKHP